MKISKFYGGQSFCILGGGFPIFSISWKRGQTQENATLREVWFDSHIRGQKHVKLTLDLGSYFRGQKHIKLTLDFGSYFFVNK